jgi:ubiquinone/menaquinone biosynthesis C-methylase UbiE
LAGQRVLDVGCGTGRLAAALSQRSSVWGIDASPEMLAVARRRVPPNVRLKLARAESPPFKEAWFDRVIYWLVVHLLDRPAAFRAAWRLLAPGGRACIVTFDSTYFADYWLNQYFPRFEAIDRERFPTADGLESELRGAGFEQVRILRHHQRDRIDRETALAKVAGRHISTFDLLEPEEYEEGRARVERELPAEVEYEIRWLIAVSSR